MSNVSRWRDSGRLERAVQGAGGPEPASTEPSTATAAHQTPARC
jgi:hypothetical protein